MREYIKDGVLEGDDAIALWLLGKDKWNECVEENPDARVDFSEENFDQYRARPGSTISFEGFKFPNGVSFNRATFGDGGVNFIGAKFGNGNVSFNGATFGNGGVYFIKATFGDGCVYFMDVDFGDGNVDFSGATFGDDYVSFREAIFGKGDVSFNHATFGDGDVIFTRATFRDGTVSFTGATFGDGYVSFKEATFGNGDIVFRLAAFGDATVTFSGARFGKGDVVFDYAKCGGVFDFMPLAAYQVKDLSFYGCRFKGVMNLRGTYTCVPDLRNTITSSHVDLSTLKIDKEYKKLVLQRVNYLVDTLTEKWVKKLKGILNDRVTKEYAEKNTRIKTEIKAEFPEKKWEISVKKWNEELEKSLKTDPETLPPLETLKNKYKEKIRRESIEQVAAQFCRLKELAEQNRAHDKAFDFFADECQVKRGNQNKARVWLDKAYAGACRHGRSIRRPFGWLVGSWFVFSGIYYYMSHPSSFKSCFKFKNVSPECGDAVLLTIMNSVPFLGFTRHGYNNIFCKLFGSDPSLWVYMTIGSQSLIAFILLFLIGLGIRNRFRI